MKRLASLMLVCCVAPTVPASAAPIREGMWRAWLDCPGGELPFELEIRQVGEAWRALVLNGDQKIDLTLAVTGAEIVLDFTHYDSTITATSSQAGSRLDGRWKKRSGADKWAELPFHATAGAAPRFATGAPEKAEAGQIIDGRWVAQFSQTKHPLIGQFKTASDGSATGTFLTPTGDYGYLAGTFGGGRLRMSSFDGSHAFLVDARLEPDGTLAGDFWSRDTWHETWSARRDDSASLPDAFTQTKAKGPANLSELAFRDLEGKTRTLSEFAGEAVIIEVFGSWCPNCHDASEFMNELHAEYRQKGLSIIGLAFELTGDFERDARQVRRFAQRHETAYPVLLAGTSDRKLAGGSLPMIDELKAYPTFIILDATGQVIATYTGFSGPATGQAYHDLRRQFQEVIERALGET